MFCELKLNRHLHTPQLILNRSLIFKKIKKVRIKILNNQTIVLITGGGKKGEKFVAARRDLRQKLCLDSGKSRAAGLLLVGAGEALPQRRKPLGKELLRLHGESCLTDFQLSSFLHSMAVPAAFMQGCTLARKRVVLFR